MLFFLEAGFWSTSASSMEMCWYNAKFHGTQVSFQPSSVERGFFQKTSCWILSETHYGFIVAYLSHNGSYCMCNEKISLMLKMRFCMPVFLYQSLILVVLLDTDFSFKTLPPKNFQQQQKKTPKKPPQNPKLQPTMLLKPQNSSKKKKLRPTLYVELLRW